MKNILIGFMIVVVAIFGLIITKDQVLKSIITTVATQVTGASVRMDSFHLGVFSQSVRISGFKMYNPKGFSNGVLIDMPKINVAYDLGALLKKKIHLINAEIELKEMDLEKNKEGKLNVDSLKVVEESKKQTGKEQGKPAEQMPLQIDHLKLGIGKIINKDLSKGPAPTVQVYDVNIHKEYKNITSAQQLVLLILSEPMKAAGIQSAKVYGVAMLAGTAVLPVAIAVNLAGKDSAQQEFSAGLAKAYQVSADVLKHMGRVTKEDQAAGVIDADINGATVVLKLKEKDNKTEIVVSARKYLFPKPEVAGGVLYEIEQKLK